MTIILKCSCGHNFSAPDHTAGKRVPCPTCRSLVAVPFPDAEIDSTTGSLISNTNQTPVLKEMDSTGFTSDNDSVNKLQTGLRLLSIGLLVIFLVGFLLLPIEAFLSLSESSSHRTLLGQFEVDFTYAGCGVMLIGLWLTATGTDQGLTRNLILGSALSMIVLLISISGMGMRSRIPDHSPSFDQVVNLSSGTHQSTAWSWIGQASSLLAHLLFLAALWRMSDQNKAPRLTQAVAIFAVISVLMIIGIFMLEFSLNDLQPPSMSASADIYYRYFIAIAAFVGFTIGYLRLVSAAQQLLIDPEIVSDRSSLTTE